MSKKDKSRKLQIGDLVLVVNDPTRIVWRIINIKGRSVKRAVYEITSPNLLGRTLFKKAQELIYITSGVTNINNIEDSGLADYKGCTSCFSKKFDYDNTFKFKPKFKIGDRVTLKAYSTFHSTENVEVRSSFSKDKTIIITNIVTDYKNKKVFYHFEDDAVVRTWNSTHAICTISDNTFFIEEKDLKEGVINILDNMEKTFLNNILCVLYQAGIKCLYIAKNKTDVTFSDGSTEYIKFYFKDETKRFNYNFIDLPAFKAGHMYRGMELGHQYTLKDLGLNDSLMDYVRIL